MKCMMVEILCTLIFIGNDIGSWTCTQLFYCEIIYIRLSY